MSRMRKHGPNTDRRASSSFFFKLLENNLITHVTQLYNNSFFPSLQGKTVGEEPPEKATTCFSTRPSVMTKT